MPSVTRRASRSPEHRSAVIAQVTTAVERLLADGHGFTTLGVQRIADEAGIARSTFYLYFPDKSALLVQVTESATAELFASAQDWLADGFADLAALEHTLLEVIGQLRAHAEVYAALVEVAGYDEEVAAFWRARVAGFSDVLRARIEEGQRAGTIAAALDPAITAEWIAWGTERLIAQHTAIHPASEDARLARGLATATWATLGRT